MLSGFIAQVAFIAISREASKFDDLDPIERLPNSNILPSIFHFLPSSIVFVNQIVLLMSNPYLPPDGVGTGIKLLTPFPRRGESRFRNVPNPLCSSPTLLGRGTKRAAFTLLIRDFSLGGLEGVRKGGTCMAATLAAAIFGSGRDLVCSTVSSPRVS